jgi:hypothetical protein
MGKLFCYMIWLVTSCQYLSIYKNLGEKTVSQIIY